MMESFFCLLIPHIFSHYRLHPSHRNCYVTLQIGNLEKKIAGEIVDNENNIEDCVTKKLNDVIEERLTVVKKQKSIVAKSHQDHEAAKQKHQVSERQRDYILFWIQSVCVQMN